jgi:hypothetical protein
VTLFSLVDVESCFSVTLMFFQILLILKLLLTIPPPPVVDRALSVASNVIRFSVSERSSSGVGPTLDLATGVEQ